MKKMSLKARLFSIVAIPIIVILGFSINEINYSLNAKESISMAKKRISEVEAISKIVHFMQIERGQSVGFIVSNGTKNRDTLPKTRENLNNSIEEMKKIVAKADENIFLSSLNELNAKRSSIDSFSSSSMEAVSYYTTAILSCIDIISVIPLTIDDRDSRNIAQAYSHLTSIKEQLGQIRANLNEAFSKNTLSFNAAINLGGSIKIRDLDIRKFKLSATKELKNIFESSYKGEVV